MAPPRSRKRMTYAEKLEIVLAIEKGEKKAHLARKYEVNESTIRTIFKDREKVNKMAKSSAVQSNTLMQSLTLRNPTLQDTERVLARFLLKQNRRGMPFDGGMIRKKAKTIYKEVARMRGITNPPHFIASKGWCTKFIRRHNLRRVSVTGEAASADETAAQEFPSTLRKIIEEGGYSLDQIFNTDETGLVWKKMPTKTYLAKHERAARGFKPIKDRITLLLTINASGTFRMKPLVIHKAKRPRPYRNMDMSKLNVHWFSNRKAWMSSALCVDWFDKFFARDVERFCKVRKIPFNILLLLDNAPAHPTLLRDRHPNINVVFIPPNTTSLIQPMDQEVIANVKASYASKTFAMLEAAACTDVQEDIAAELGQELVAPPPASHIPAAATSPSHSPTPVPAAAASPSPSPRPVPAASPSPSPSHVTGRESESDSENVDDPATPPPPRRTAAAASLSAPTTSRNAGQKAVIQFWKQFDIKTAVDLFVESWKELSDATIHHAWRNVLEGLPGHKFDHPESQRQSYEATVQQAVQAARQVVGMDEVDQHDIEDLINPPEEETMAQIFEDSIEEEDEQQQQKEEEGAETGEPRTAELRKFLEIVETAVRQCFSMDPNSARAYEILTDIKRSVRRYDDMLGDRANRMQQRKITAFFRRHQEEQQQQRAVAETEEIDAGGDSDVSSDSDIDDVMSDFEGFDDPRGDEEPEEEAARARPASPQPSTSAETPPSPL